MENAKAALTPRGDLMSRRECPGHIIMNAIMNAHQYSSRAAASSRRSGACLPFCSICSGYTVQLFCCGRKYCSSADPRAIGTEPCCDHCIYSGRMFSQWLDSHQWLPSWCAFRQGLLAIAADLPTVAGAALCTQALESDPYRRRLAPRFQHIQPILCRHQWSERHCESDARLRKLRVGDGPCSRPARTNGTPGTV